MKVLQLIVIAVICIIPTHGFFNLEDWLPWTSNNENFSITSAKSSLDDCYQNMTVANAEISQLRARLVAIEAELKAQNLKLEDALKEKESDIPHTRVKRQYPGGLPACLEQLNLTEVNYTMCIASLLNVTSQLSTCNTNLNNCSSYATNCSNNLTACNTNLVNCSSFATNCSNNLTICDTSLANCSSFATNCSNNLTTCETSLTNCSSFATNCSNILTTCETSLTNCSSFATNCSNNLTNCDTSLANCSSFATNCSNNLTTCDTSLANCSSYATNCSNNLTTCDTSLANCSTFATNCSNTLINCTTNLENCTNFAENCSQYLANCNSTSCLNNLTACEAQLQNLTYLYGNCSLNLTSCFNDLAACRRPCGYKLGLVPLATGSYYFSNTKLNWFGALNYCKKYGMDLTDVNSEVEKDVLKDELTFHLKKRGFLSKSYWIGLNNLGESSSFSFISNGNLDWGLLGSLSTLGRGSCISFTSILHLFSFKLMAHDCNSLNYFICKLPPYCL